MAAQLAGSYLDLKAKLGVLGKTVPTNTGEREPGIPLYRTRDCAVLEHLHAARAKLDMRPYDTVVGAFDEGSAAFEGAAIRQRSHIQLAVRNRACILATFHQQAH